MTTIKDVAKLANVSVATVSRYINKSGYVSSEAESNIANAIRELNYAPNQVARSLAKKQMHTIGLIVPDITNPFFPELARAIEDTALKAGYTVILCNSDEQQEKERNYIEILQQKYIAGFIIATNQLPIEQYKKLNRPVVLLDRTIDTELPSVSSQNELGAELATKQLLKSAPQNIAFFSGPSELLPVQQRLKGFAKVMKRANKSFLTFESKFNYKEAEEIALNALQQQPQIDAVFACSDTIAIGVMKAAQKLGKNIPADLEIIGFDGISMSEMVTPSLTSVAQNIYELGETAANMVIRQVNGEELHMKHVAIKPTLIIRDSTKGESI